MDRMLIGEVLGRMGQLTAHDIDEVLSEQRATRQRFGTIAVSLGFCQPEHIWAAWCNQLDGRVDPVDLNAVGIDTQAVDCLPRELATGLKALPIRVWEDQLIVAVHEAASAEVMTELGRRVGMKVRCVLTSKEQLEKALESHYPSPQAA